jgi:rhamnulokinase
VNVKTKQYLALDLGAESGRAILGGFDGQRLSLKEISRFENAPVRLHDGIHWDILRLWKDIQDGISMAIRQTTNPISSIGLDTWGVDFCLLDRQGGLIGNPFHYRDNRTDGILEEAFKRMPKEQIFAYTGIQFMQLNTLFQLLSMVENRSPWLEIANTLLTMPDLFNYWLTGEMASEFSIATTTQCYDPRRENWCEPLLHAMGIPLSIFPKIIPPGTILGKVRREVGEVINNPQLQVVAPACHDTGSAVAAVPATGNNFAWISSGTWSIMGINSPEPIINDQTLADNFTNEGGVNHLFRFSKNITGLWLVQQCRRTWNAAGKDSTYATLTEMAAKSARHFAVIDPDDDDFMKPGDMPARIREFCKRTSQPIPTSEGEIVRLALEGLALKYRWVLEKIEALTKTKIEKIHIIGGGTQNRLLSQFTADVTGRVTITGPIEATAIGNILTQAIAAGDIRSIDEAKQVITNSFEPETFEPEDTSGWDDAYTKLLELLE